MNLIFAWLISKLSFALLPMMAKMAKTSLAPIPCPIDRPLQQPDRTFQ